MNSGSAVLTFVVLPFVRYIISEMSTQRIVITGVNGFVGKHLVRELKDYNFEVIGVDRSEVADDSIVDMLSDYVVGDLAVSWPKFEGVTAVIHLAGLAAVGLSFDNPQDYININSAIFTNMAEHFLASGEKPRLVVVSSGAIYDPNQTMPLTEASDIGYTSPYTVSKVLVENQCEYYRSRGLDCIVARPFNHIGPGQRPGFLLPDLYEQILAVKNSNKPLKVGNLKTKRDYTDVRDVVRAYRQLATTESLANYVYNICSEESVSGEKILQLVQELTGTADLVVEIDKSKIRPTDPLDFVGSNTRLKADTGWKPKIKLKKTISDFINSK